jgi:hypothetical protein
MREIRNFEIEYDEPAVCWRVARPTHLKVTRGLLWLTVEGEARDHWLAAGEAIELQPGMRVWGSAGAAGGVHLALAFTREFAGARIGAVARFVRTLAVA